MLMGIFLAINNDTSDVKAFVGYQDLIDFANEHMYAYSYYNIDGANEIEHEQILTKGAIDDD